MKQDAAESTNRLLKVIIALMLRGKDAEKPTLRQRVEILADLGLKPTEIGEILGRTNIYVNKELFSIRKQRSSKA